MERHIRFPKFRSAASPSREKRLLLKFTNISTRSTLLATSNRGNLFLSITKERGDRGSGGISTKAAEAVIYFLPWNIESTVKSAILYTAARSKDRLTRASHKRLFRCSIVTLRSPVLFMNATVRWTFSGKRRNNIKVSVLKVSFLWRIRKQKITIP